LKNSTLRRYITLVAIYSMLYVLVLVILDNVFDGVVVDFLYDRLPAELFYRISANRIAVSLLGYILGLLIISLIYVFKLNRLLHIASSAIQKEDSVVFGERCPEELRAFSEKLKEFKHQLKENELAREMAEQQKNDLIVYLAHDLKTPLTSVIGYLSLLEEAKDLPVEQKAKYTGIALQKARRLEQLINEFFDITRLNLQTIQTQRSNINLTILLVQVLNEFFPMFEEKGLQLEQSIQPELMIRGDADKLARVFDNLFRNAVNYSYENTPIRCQAYAQNSFAIISIQNVGDHIPPEKLEHIFDKFYRADSARQSDTGGAGLGLAIAKQIVELHSGTIHAFCHGETIEFRISLPLLRKK